MKIPYNKPFVVGKELYYIAQAVMNGQLSGDGPFTKRCHTWFEKNLNSKKALLTHSCTSALEMAAILCDIQPGDEIIMPSFTFVSTANAFILRGGVPVFIDIREDTLNLDERIIESAITPKTKAIVAVHYAGVGCEMDHILSLARKYNLFVIEDAAQGLLSKYKDKFLGTIGDLGCLSFHETKNVISGEGGALLINNEKMIERAEIIREKGTNRSKYFRGEIDKYTWVDIGSSFLPGELIAAFLFAQLENSEKITEARRYLFHLYFEHLQPLEKKGVIRLPIFDQESPPNGHIFYVIAHSINERTRLIEHLKKHDIMAVFHYVPLHSSPAGKRFGKTCGNLKNTDVLSDGLLRLPLFFGMTDESVLRVVRAIKDFYS
ncbi:MAG: dTDP-4-amino-4,6-dideoxygalactose transaminase [Candidatus Ozemobacteraceae bacterium]